LAPGESTVACPACRGQYHAECWQYNGGCGVYGCAQAATTERLTSLEIPASYWGREDKPCPSCGQSIMAAAVRCRHCGATFSSATPVGAAAYHRRKELQSKLPGLRTFAIWLLVFSLIPCTAPLAAIAGLFWYLANREAIRALPPLHSAIGKIALGVAWGQTLLLALFGLVAGMSHGAVP
jgi:hypothetical protein